MSENPPKKFSRIAKTIAKSCGSTLTTVWSGFVPFERDVLRIFGVLFAVFVALLWHLQKMEYMPASFGALATAMFAFLAYRFSKEKFRMDLATQRWEIYVATLEFCSVVTQQGSLHANNNNRDQIVAALKAANNSFRSIGYHKSLQLFGDDIHTHFKKLNDGYAWFTAFSERPNDPVDSENWSKLMYDNSMLMWDTTNLLPDMFKPYLYFGDYRR